MKFHDALIEAIDYWNLDIVEDQWFFEKFRQDHIEQMKPQEVFFAIEGTMAILLEERDESTAVEILQTAINLARKSQTTELPNIILENKFFKFSIYSKKKLNELFRYYRL